jgi:hypothetical protein
MLLLSSPLDAGRLRIRKNQEKLDTAGQENINLECSASPLLPGCIYVYGCVDTREKRERERDRNQCKPHTNRDRRASHIYKSQVDIYTVHTDSFKKVHTYILRERRNRKEEEARPESLFFPPTLFYSSVSLRAVMYQVVRASLLYYTTQQQQQLSFWIKDGPIRLYSTSMCVCTAYIVHCPTACVYVGLLLLQMKRDICFLSIPTAKKLWPDGCTVRHFLFVYAQNFSERRRP